jgi:hypothetical protein
MRNKKSNFRGKVADNARNRQASTSYGHLLLPKDVKVWNAEPGTKNVMFDVLPYTVTDPKHPDRNAERDVAVVGNLWYTRPYRVHRKIGVEEETVVCLSSFKEACPICEAREKQAKDGATKEQLKPLNTSRRHLYAIKPIGMKDYDEVPHVFDIAYSNFQELLDKEVDEDELKEVFPDPDEGFTLKVRFDAATFAGSKPYPEASRIDFIERDAPIDQKILDAVPNLDEMLKHYTYKELADKYYELDAEPDGGKLNENLDEEQGTTDGRARKTLKTDNEPEATTGRTGGSRRTAAPVETPPPDLPTWEELKNIDRANLVTMAAEYKLPFGHNDFEDSDAGDDVFRKAIADELKIEVPARSGARRTISPAAEPEKAKTTGRKDTSPASENAEKSAAIGKGIRNGQAAAGDETCPFGHVFGKDTERFDDCDDCKLFDACLDAKKAAANKK